MLRVLTWPFRMLWSLVGVVFLAVGKLFCLILGLTLAAVGVTLCCTIVGALAGVPLLLVGGTMFIRALF